MRTLCHLAVGTALAFGLNAGAQAAEPPVDVVASGLAHPWAVAFIDQGRFLVTERPGRIRVYESGSPGANLERTIVVPNVRTRSSTGMAATCGNFRI